MTDTQEITDLTHGRSPQHTAIIRTKEQGDVLVELQRMYLIKTVYTDTEQTPHGIATWIESVDEPRFPNAHDACRVVNTLNIYFRDITQSGWVRESTIKRIERA